MKRIALVTVLLSAFVVSLQPGIVHADPSDTVKTKDDPAYTTTTIENGDGSKIVTRESKRTGYWTTDYVDSKGNRTQIAKGTGDGSVKTNAHDLRPTAMNDNVKVEKGDGYTMTTVTNKDGTSIIHTKFASGSWETRAADKDGNDKLVALGDGKGNVAYPKPGK